MIRPLGALSPTRPSTTPRAAVPVVIPSQDVDGVPIDLTVAAAPSLGTRPAPVPSPATAAFCQAAWPLLGVRGREGHVYGEQMDLRRHVLGEPRLNRPYPDPALLTAGLPQPLPLDVQTPFKWLLSPPQPLGDAVLLHAQHEGGPGSCGDEELECRDLFIAVRENPQTRRFEEVAHLQTKPSEYAYVYRSTGPPEVIGDRHFVVRIEEGTYSSGIFARHTHLYTLDTLEGQAIREVGTWSGHLSSADPTVMRALG